MEMKTKVEAVEGQPDILITRVFELPVELLFKAYEDASLFEQWMSHEYGKVKVVKHENRKHGGWKFQTSDASGNVVFSATGVFHDFVPNQKITRTFEMENSPLDVQLEFLVFEKLTDDTSKLTIQSVFRSVQLRDELLRNPFAAGLSMAHNRLQEVVSKLK